MQLKSAIIIGAGDRGARAYAPYALQYPNELKIIAVAEPNEERRRGSVNLMPFLQKTVSHHGRKC